MDNIANLLKLIAENPGTEILPVVDVEPCGGDEFPFRVGHWGKAMLDDVYTDDHGLTFLRARDEDLLIGEAYEEADEKYSDDEAMEVAKEMVKGYKWKKAIVVYITV